MAKLVWGVGAEQQRHDVQAMVNRACLQADRALRMIINQALFTFDSWSEIPEWNYSRIYSTAVLRLTGEGIYSKCLERLDSSHPTPNRREST